LILIWEFEHVDKRPSHVDGFRLAGGYFANFGARLAGHHQYFVQL
jgi:hypothetical protein